MNNDYPFNLLKDAPKWSCYAKLKVGLGNVEENIFTDKNELEIKKKSRQLVCQFHSLASTHILYILYHKVVGKIAHSF